MRQVFLDTETTGLEPDKGDRIIELACVEMRKRKLSGRRLQFYLNPERDSHEDALKIHGIGNEFLRDKPKFALIADQLIDFIAGAELIIHNAPFDSAFLDAEFKRLGRPPLREQVAVVTDTLAMAREIYPGKRNSLDALCERLGVDNSSRTLHGALLDAELLAEVYICLTRGQNSLLGEDGDATQRLQDDPGQDLRAYRLPIPIASEQELRAHEILLAELDQASRGRTVWRQAEIDP